MAPLKALLASALLLLVGAGCVEPAPLQCEGDACANVGPLPDDFGFWESTETVQLAGCQGGAANIEVPAGPVRALVPEAFRLDGWTPGTVKLLVRSVACGRIATNTTVFEAASVQKILAFVIPADAAWRLDGVHHFVLGVLVSDLRLAEFLSSSVPASAAAFTTRSLPAGLDVVDAWNVKADDCSFEYQFERSDSASLPMSGVFHEWHGTDEIRRLEVRQTYQYDEQASAGLLHAEGSCPEAQASGPAFPYAALAYPSLEASWVQDPRIYEPDG